MLAALREIINSDVMVSLDTHKNELLLKEDSADSKLKKLYITNMPSEVVAFTLDHQPGGNANRWFKQLSPYVDLSNDKGVNKGCDLIVIWQDEDKNIALIFDLKSDKPKVNTTQMQLDNSELYLKYLLSMVEHHYKIDTDGIEIKKAIATTDSRGVRKGATYRPNLQHSQVGDYNIESVCPKAYKTGYIPLQKLAR